MQKYNEELKNEFEQFLFLCEKKDGTMLISKVKKSYMEEFVRLACLSIVFGYKKVFMKIVAHTEKFFALFMKGLKSVSKNFYKIDDWTTEFIGNVEHPEIQNLMCEFWKAQKTNLDPVSFNIQQLLK